MFYKVIKESNDASAGEPELEQSRKRVKKAALSPYADPLIGMVNFVARHKMQAPPITYTTLL